MISTVVAGGNAGQRNEGGVLEQQTKREQTVTRVSRVICGATGASPLSTRPSRWDGSRADMATAAAGMTAVSSGTDVASTSGAAMGESVPGGHGCRRVGRPTRECPPGRPASAARPRRSSARRRTHKAVRAGRWSLRPFRGRSLSAHPRSHVPPRPSARGADPQGLPATASPPHRSSAETYTAAVRAGRRSLSPPAASSAMAGRTPPPRRSSVRGADPRSRPVAAPPLHRLSAETYPHGCPRGAQIAAPVPRPHSRRRTAFPPPRAARPRRRPPTAVRAWALIPTAARDLPLPAARPGRRAPAAVPPRPSARGANLRGRPMAVAPPRLLRGALIPAGVPWPLPLPTARPRRHTPMAVCVGRRSPRTSKGLVHGGGTRSPFPREGVVALAPAPRRSARAATRSEDGGTRHCTRLYVTFFFEGATTRNNKSIGLPKFKKSN